jgi:AGCS family alanine or glycine:cation symporter
MIIFFISKPAIKALKDYEAQRKAGVKEYTFNPEKLGIKGADFWVKRYAERSVKAPAKEPEKELNKETV